ncbi:MAG: glucose-1-phosphate cytidylyltransferase [Deltaproteobacteria bacterium]|nr:glucose-1-phosphate cytidylyltransferase [Deltaproteobacteria bacterium]
MKVVILAGGLGTRLSEETTIRPKPMVEVGGRPILWHIMKGYAQHGLTDFVICLGYKGYVIKEYFANYFLHMCDVTFDLANNRLDVHHSQAEPWKVTLVDTGESTQTGGRVRRIAKYLDGDDFMLTYGDGVADIDITALLAFHRAEGRLATVTGVQPPGRFGSLELDGSRATGFAEKPIGDGGWINGGFFVLSRKLIDYVDADDTVWEKQPMERLAREGQLSVYLHRGFWQPMDTMRDRSQLETMWSTGRAPWRTWT